MHNIMFTELYLINVFTLAMYIHTYIRSYVIGICFSFSSTKEELHKIMSVFTTRLYEHY